LEVICYPNPEAGGSIEEIKIKSKSKREEK